MLWLEKRIAVAFLIALAGLALTVVSFTHRQTLIGEWGAAVTILFVVCATALERSNRR